MGHRLGLGGTQGRVLCPVLSRRVEPWGRVLWPGCSWAKPRGRELCPTQNAKSPGNTKPEPFKT
ncbi:hypothetical protein BAZO_20478 [Schinkia azotoformans LMG 9581]|uniref:Uncharacterized protein n=1 Tax=Schinkia azotoformans LMG 9581 TaxID=1131731 RepID=K6DPW9_SCHAZ|nr:hypothetical protein BAZO_20478 [Schinkia azotoformans LMG 9581]